jgi:hypothetical protein
MPFDSERAARVAYAAIRQLREEQGQSRGPVWELLVPEERSWYRRAVELAAIGVRLPNIHDDWRRGLEQSGWACGPDIDHVKKSHPGLLPWPALSDDQRRRLSVLQMITMALSLDVMSGPVPVTPL